MERVVTINLNGNPYQLDEPAYDALRVYLGRAEAALAANPDKTEILRDLEQAMADKAAAYLSPQKSVISAAEMTRILEEMGPVEGDEAAGATASATSGERPNKRLYRIVDDAKIAGVCSGIGAYFDLDANIVRILFVVLALFTSGFFILVYVAMMFLVPSAQTSEEWAAAHGVPFNAQEVIDRAKREYSSLTEGPNARWGRERRRAWRNRMNERAHNWAQRSDSAPSAEAPIGPLGYVARMFAGLCALVFSLVGAALLIAFLVTLFALLSTGAIFGWHPPGDMPNWLLIVILAIAYAAIASPFAALRRSSYAAATGHRYRDHGDGLLALGLIALAAWLAYLFVPDARDFFQALPVLWNQWMLELIN